MVQARASSSRSQRAMWPTTTLTLSDLPRTVRGRPLVSACVCGGCYSVSYSPASQGGTSDHRSVPALACTPLLALEADAAIRNGFGVPGAQPVAFHARGQKHGGARRFDCEQDACTGQLGCTRPQLTELQRGPGRAWRTSIYRLVSRSTLRSLSVELLSTSAGGGSKPAWPGAQRLLSAHRPDHEVNGVIDAQGERQHDQWQLVVTRKTVTSAQAN